MTARSARSSRKVLQRRPQRASSVARTNRAVWTISPRWCLKFSRSGNAIEETVRNGGKSLLLFVISKYLKNFVPSRSSRDMLKQIKDEYQILSELGTGGMATIYKAIHKTLDRPVAIKELKKAYHTDEQIVQRFEREAKMSASFQHENIVHIYDYWKKPDFCIVMEYVDGTDLADIKMVQRFEGEAKMSASFQHENIVHIYDYWKKPDFCIVMEYVDGTDLADIIEKTGSVPVDVGIMIAIQVCSALDYAHMRGLIHRDIKPSNIMVKRNGEVKLMDFGIAHTKKLQTLTLPGTFLGTPAYMSPEQILGQSLDNQSDIFSLGIVLYEMFTGIKPFQDEETHSVTAKILKDRFLPPRRLNSDIPRRLQRVIKKCLKKKTAKRYQSVLDLARALGKRLIGTTNKSASLKRISDYLVEVKVFAAPPENETMVITKVPAGRLLKRLLVAT